MAENFISKFHNVDSALLYNSGYDANVGFFSSVANRQDVVLYDEFIHASIRDGLSMSNSKTLKFKHNDLTDLDLKIERCQKTGFRGNIFIVTESVFSMDGDSPDLLALTKLAQSKDSYLIIDEAHSIGVFGEKGEGLVQELGLENRFFARIVTFGKALGAHGAAILGSSDLKEYLINFSRSLIYSTALPPQLVATILAAYEQLESSAKKSTTESGIKKLGINIDFFKNEIQRLALEDHFTTSQSAIQACVVPGNEKVKFVARELQSSGFDVKPILSPTVPPENECLRFCLHSFNTEKEISEVLIVLSKLL